MQWNDDKPRRNSDGDPLCDGWRPVNTDLRRWLRAIESIGLDEQCAEIDRRTNRRHKATRACSARWDEGHWRVGRPTRADEECSRRSHQPRPGETRRAIAKHARHAERIEPRHMPTDRCEVRRWALEPVAGKSVVNNSVRDTLASGVLQVGLGLTAAGRPNRVVSRRGGRNGLRSPGRHESQTW